MLWCVLLLLLIGLLLLPVGIVTDYGNQHLEVFLKLGFVKLLLYPSRRDESKRKDANKKSGEKGNNEKKSVDQELQTFLPIFKSILTFLEDFRKCVKVNDLRVKIVLAGSDPCDLSVYYGYTCAAVSSLIPHINRLLYVKKQKIDVNCDYLSEHSTISGYLDFSLPFFILLKLAYRHGTSILKYYHSIKTKEKVV